MRSSLNGRLDSLEQRAKYYRPPVKDDPTTPAESVAIWRDRVAEVRRCVDAGLVRPSHSQRGLEVYEDIICFDCAEDTWNEVTHLIYTVAKLTGWSSAVRTESGLPPLPEHYPCTVDELSMWLDNLDEMLDEWQYGAIQ